MDEGEDDAGAAPWTAGSGALVGREAEIGQLAGGLDAVVAGRSQVVLLAGDAGIGKSRLADEAARLARDRGLAVVWGRCWEAGGAPAYWPWVQVLRSCLRDLPADPPAPVPADEIRVVEELAQLRADAPATGTDAESARFGQFDAVTNFVVATARRRPMALVLDDLQSADAPSLLLLRFLANQLVDAPLMLLATFRREDLVTHTPLTEAVAELTRLPLTRRLDLAGLGEPEVARVVEAVTGVRPPAAVIATLTQQTAGNPFFVSEISRLAAAEGRLEESDPAYWERTIPQGVRQVVGLRIDRLSRECARVLSLGSVLGREFGVNTLGQLSGLELDDLEEVLDEAIDSGLLAADPLTPGAFRFSHAVIRDTLYDELPPSHRARLHLRAGELLEAVGSTSRSAEVAHHYFHSGPRAGVERIVTSARRAGDESLDLLAYEEAARLYRMALTALSWADTPDLRAECDLHLALGDAASRAGDHDETRRSFVRAGELAEALGDSRSFALASLGYGGRFVWLRAAADPQMLPMLERALESVDDHDLDLKIPLMARVAGAKRDEMDRAPRAALSAETVALARRSGDDRLLAVALAGRHAALLGPSHAPHPQEWPDELIGLATRLGDAELMFEGQMHLMLQLIEHGDLTRAERAVDELDRLARDLHQPTHEWFAIASRANIALLHGRFEEAEALIGRAVQVGLRSQNFDTQGYADIQRFVLRREQGRLDELRDRVQASIHAYPTRPIFACIGAVLAMECGDRLAAAAILDRLSVDRFGAIPLNNDWSLSTSLLAEVAHALGDASRAAELYDVMLPAAGSCEETSEVCTGALDAALGLLAATAARLDEAVDHLELAVATNDRIGAMPWAAHARLALAEVLAIRAADGDTDRAGAALERAKAVSGYARVTQRCREVESALEASGARAGRSVKPADAPPRAASFRCEGDLWVVGIDGAEHHVRATKGLRHIATLLAAPGQQVHVLDLVGALEPAARGQAHHADPGLRPSGAGPDEILDARARAAYRERIEALQGEIDEAEQWNDQGRASRAREELDFLIEELTAASGLGGRSRSFTTDAERARVNATRAIRAAVSKIGEHDADLAWHLDRSLRTGTYCSYEPDREAPVVWAL